MINKPSRPVQPTPVTTTSNKRKRTTRQKKQETQLLNYNITHPVIKPFILTNIQPTWRIPRKPTQIHQMKIDLLSIADLSEHLQELAVHKDDMINNQPTEKFLRRLFEYFVGFIVSWTTEIIQTTSPAIVKVTINYRPHHCPDEINTISAIGESSFDNTSDAFAIFPLSTAETRAFSRAWRRALNIRVPTAEEVSLPSGSDTTTTEEQIADNMLETLVNKMASDKNIDVNVICNTLFGKEWKDLNIEEKRKAYLAIKESK